MLIGYAGVPTDSKRWPLDSGCQHLVLGLWRTYELGSSMPSGFKINRQAIAKMKRELEREFNKGGGIRVPLEVDPPPVAAWPSTTTYNRYDGPVVISSGDGAQIAVGDHATQTQTNTQITPGYEGLAEAVTLIMEKLSTIELPEGDREIAEEVSGELLTEVTQETPDPKRLRRAIAALKGVLAPIATGAATGVGAAVNAESQEWAHQALDLLQTAVF